MSTLFNMHLIQADMPTLFIMHLLHPYMQTPGLQHAHQLGDGWLPGAAVGYHMGYAL